MPGPRLRLPCSPLLLSPLLLLLLPLLCGAATPTPPTNLASDGRLSLGVSESVTFTGATCQASDSAQVYLSSQNCVSTPSLAAAGGTARDTALTGCSDAAQPTVAEFTFTTAGTYKICYIQVDEPYKTVATGTCANIGCVDITTAVLCDTAATALNLDDKGSAATTNAGAPKGCYSFTNGGGTNFLFVNDHGTGSGTATADTLSVCDCRLLPNIFTQLPGTWEVATELPSSYTLTPIAAAAVAVGTSLTKVKVAGGKGLDTNSADAVKVVNSATGCAEGSALFLDPTTNTFTALTPTSSTAVEATSPDIKFDASGTFSVCYRPGSATARYPASIATGRCADTAGCLVITTSGQCDAASAGLGLSDPSSTGATDVGSPPGCYFDGTSLILNSHGTGTAASAGKVAVCDCVGASAFRTVGGTFVINPKAASAAATGSLAPVSAAADGVQLVLTVPIVRGLAADGQIWVTVPLLFQSVTPTPTTSVTYSGVKETVTPTVTGSGPWTIKMARGGAGAVVPVAATSAQVDICCLKNPPYEIPGGQALYSIVQTVHSNGLNVIEEYDSGTHASAAAKVVISPGIFAAGPTITLASLAAGATSDATVSFTARSLIPNDGTIILVVPASFTAVAASTVTILSGMDGTASAAVSGGGASVWTVTITRGGGGSNVAANTAVSVKLSGFRNQARAGYVGSFAVTTRRVLASVSTRIDENTAVTGPITLPATMASRPVMNYLTPMAGVMSALEIEFVPSVDMPANGTVVLEFPDGYTFDPAALQVTNVSASLVNPASSSPDDHVWFTATSTTTLVLNRISKDGAGTSAGTLTSGTAASFTVRGINMPKVSYTLALQEGSWRTYEVFYPVISTTDAPGGNVLDSNVNAVPKGSTSLLASECYAFDARESSARATLQVCLHLAEDMSQYCRCYHVHLYQVRLL